jgi:hypothetical protein
VRSTCVAYVSPLGGRAGHVLCRSGRGCLGRGCLGRGCLQGVGRREVGGKNMRRTNAVLAGVCAHAVRGWCPHAPWVDGPETRRRRTLSSVILWIPLCSDAVDVLWFVLGSRAHLAHRTPRAFDSRTAAAMCAARCMYSRVPCGVVWLLISRSGTRYTSFHLRSNLSAVNVCGLERSAWRFQ